MSTAADIKAALKAGRTSLGGWLTLPSAALAECLAECGFDWLAVDLEHGSATTETAAAAFRAAERLGVAPFARLPSADPYLARRLLDQGCQGLIVPAVDSAEDFTEFASHCFYPPAGRRGVGLARGNGFGKDFEAYMSGFSPVLVPQIETPAGVDAAAAIAALPFVDSLFLGPYDLSVSLGLPGDFSAPVVHDAIHRVREACATHRKAPGIHQLAPVRDGLDARIAEGYRLIGYGTDVQAILHVFSTMKS